MDRLHSTLSLVVIASLAVGPHCFCMTCPAPEGAEMEASETHSCCSSSSDEGDSIDRPVESTECCCDEVPKVSPMSLDGATASVDTHQALVSETCFSSNQTGFSASRRVLPAWPPGCATGEIPIYIKTGHLLI